MSRDSTYPKIDLTGADIHAEGEALRSRGKAVLAELPDGVLVWWVTDFGLAKKLLLDERVSRDTYQHWPAWGNGESELAKTWPLAIWVSDRNMITAYGGEHQRLRRVIAGAFTARRTAEMRPYVQSVVENLLDKIESRYADSSTFDIRGAYAYPIPVEVISKLLGITGDLKEEILSGIASFMDTDASQETAEENIAQLYNALERLVASKERHPGDDIVSALVQSGSQENEGGLSEREIIDTILLIYTAGHETTVNLLDHAIARVLANPDVRHKLETKQVSWSSIIEETLRVEAPFTNLPMRYAIEDIHYPQEEIVIKKGDPIIIAFAAAGRDPLIHGSDADQFNPERETLSQHIAFGHGVHRCIGAPLARLEASIALPALFGRFPGLKIATPFDELQPLGSFISNGHSQLPVSI